MRKLKAEILRENIFSGNGYRERHMFDIPAAWQLGVSFYRIVRNAVKISFILLIVNFLVNFKELTCFKGSKT
jgi:hypothetical protein